MPKLVNRMTKDEWLQEFSRRLVARMEYLEMTQTELTKRSGLDQMSISHYVNGKHCPIGYHVAALAEALIMKSSDLIDF
jgi:transcriptional regulator with XRE-family HTH domain